MLSLDEIALLKNNLSFWDRLTPSDQNLITNRSSNLYYKQNTSLFSGEDNCIGMIFIVSGVLRISMISDEGREVTLYRLYANDTCILSASCVLKSITFDVSIMADTDCQLIQINSSVYNQLAAKNLYVENFAYQIALERFSDVMWTMQQILFTSFDKRLAIFLLDETNKSGSSTLTFTHEQIARYLGSAREVVSRMLKYFAEENLITYSRGKITITNKEKLNSLCNMF